MSTPIDAIGLPPRALGALRKAGIKFAEKAAVKTDEELLALPGFGEGGLKVIREAGLKWLEAEMEVVSPPTHAGPTLSGQRSELAKYFFSQLAEKSAPGQFQGLVIAAWTLAVQFEQEGYRAQGSPLILADGMTVRFAGQDCIVRTSLKAGETIPKERQAGTVLLVKA